MMSKTKLELTWIGKDKRPRLEPRILLEDPSLSYHATSKVSENDIFDNKLIFGDNLLALKALEREYTGKVKCIYIDPPFNTGDMFENYDDGLEHSIWLGLMRERFEVFHKLMAEDGSLFVHLNDDEIDYCKVILDEIYGRNNFVNRITVDARSPSAFSTVNPGVFKASEYILWYVKDRSKWVSRSLRVNSSRDTAYNKFILNVDDHYSDWVVKPLKLAFLESINIDRIEVLQEFIKQLRENCCNFSNKEVEQYIETNFKFSVMLNLKNVASQFKTKLSKLTQTEFQNWAYEYLLERVSIKYTESELDQFVFEHAKHVFRPTEISDSGAGQETVALKKKSKLNRDKVLCQVRENYENIYILNGQQLSFYTKNVDKIEGNFTATKLLTNIWSDISWEGIAKEGGVTFRKGKKPEKLVKRCIELTTEKGDLVLDSFGGSGTTAAVAHKMGRRWITVELGDQAFTHICPRLEGVIDGRDNGGVSKELNWKGGGGFRFYKLAPSLMKKDQWDNWVINPEYNQEMLVEAMCKLEGYTYTPSETEYWNHGKGSETDFIYVTTQTLTDQQLQAISEEVGEGRTLLIIASAWRSKNIDRFTNLTLKKIPNSIIKACEWGHDDYSLNVQNLPMSEPDIEEKPKARKVKNTQEQSQVTGDLFGDQT